MPARARSYLPSHVTERLIEPTNSCRITTLIHLADIASLGEAVTRPNGRRLSKRGYTALLRTMRESTGDPNRDGYNQGHIKVMMDTAFGDYPGLEPFFNRTWDAIDESVQSGFVVSLAGRAGAGPQPGREGVPADSPLRDFTDVDHQILIVRRKVVDGEANMLVYDPMHPWNARHRGYWAPARHIRVFAERFEDANTHTLVAERVKIGAWTQAAMAKRANEQEIEDLRGRLRDAREARQAAEAALAACQEQLGGG